MMHNFRHLAQSMFAKYGAKREKFSSSSCSEALERRVFLSGNVHASISHGELSIEGDSAANSIVLDQTGLEAGQVRISGAGGTAINNKTDSIILSGLTGGVHMRLGARADSVTMQDITLPGTVWIKGEGGANALTLNNVQITKNLKIENGSNHPTTMRIANSTIGDSLSIWPGDGADDISLQSVRVKRETRIVGGDGDDQLTINDSTFDGDVKLLPGDGADIVKIESQGDAAGPPTQFKQKVLISLGDGNDILQLGVVGQTGNHSVFSRDAEFRGGHGRDILSDLAASTFLGSAKVHVREFESKLRTADTTAPTVSSTQPADHSTGVALNKKIAATFSEPMSRRTISSANVTVTGPDSTPVAGTVKLTRNTMTFTPAQVLAANTEFTVKISNGVKDLTGNSLANDFVWTFTTGTTLDTTAPTVGLTEPTNHATGVTLNKKIAATFSESMDAGTITGANVTVKGPGGDLVSGTVDYAGTTMTFTPKDLLDANTVYTGKISTGAKDLAGNPLASNFVWTFTTGAQADTIDPTVTSTNPVNLQTNVTINKTVAATFSESMNPQSIVGNFTLTATGDAPVAGTVNYDTASKIATFDPSSNLPSNTSFTATIKGGVNGVKDLAGNSLASDKVWTFSTGTQAAQTPIDLGRANGFAVMATASITSNGATHIDGDVGLRPGSSQGIPPNQVNGTVHVNDPASADAKADLLTAYNDAVSRSTSPAALPGNLGGLTLTPGLYKNAISVKIEGDGPANNVTLDALGDPDAVFIFQIGTTLTTAAGAKVILAGGAKARNIFWQVGSSATLNTTTVFKGSILASVTITVDGGSAVEGRLLGGASTGGSVTINNSTISVPTA